ncbi:MAG TPA: hypothetical protein V6D15_16260 [Oculatellaceae cyanobacterium]|jgi:hypothetical protein
MLKRLREDQLDDFDVHYRLILGTTPYTGLVYKIDKKGQVTVEYSCCEGFDWGFKRAWYSNGVLQEDYKIRFLRVYGWSKEWHSNGQLKEESFVEDSTGLVIRRKKWNEKGELIDYFALEKDPDSNRERYQMWIERKAIYAQFPEDPAIEPSPFLKDLMPKGAAFEARIIKYLAKCPSNRVYYEQDFLNDFIED